MHTDRITTHPGEMLREEFMVPLGLSANALARDLHVPPNRITAIIAREDPRAGRKIEEEVRPRAA